ncbi:hypothetical protein D9611_007460 [Ephemerocybe angulata]|uniref:F-box domain-containing protein n=1 Tax=Ephemerocybe angulata TaxID=980116 RepID=A0A8H5FL29_9AGAR|nr:hypothetical protein D9611_007460 [Tulosesus angulatus]
MSLNIGTIDDELRALTLKALSLRSQHNTLLPISRLAPELFSRIFYLATYGLWDTTSHGPSSYRRSSVILSQVCYSWRTIALSSPEIWTRIVVRPRTSVQLLQLFLSNAGGCLPLAVIIDLSGYHTTPSLHAASIQTLQRFFDTSSTFDRIESIEFHDTPSGSEFLSGFFKKTPQQSKWMKHLTLTTGNGAQNNWHGPWTVRQHHTQSQDPSDFVLFPEGLPNLRSLSLHGYSVTLCSKLTKPCKHLTSLDISLPLRDCSVFQLVRNVLQRTRALEQLRITFPETIPSTQVNHDIAKLADLDSSPDTLQFLPRLDDLQLFGDVRALMILLSRLAVPKKLAQLRIVTSLPRLTETQTRQLSALRASTKDTMRKLLRAWGARAGGTVPQAGNLPEAAASPWFPSTMKISRSMASVSYTVSASAEVSKKETEFYPITLELPNPTSPAFAVKDLLSWDISISPKSLSSEPSRYLNNPFYDDGSIHDGGLGSLRCFSASVSLPEEIWGTLAAMPFLEEVEIWGSALVFGLTSAIYSAEAPSEVEDHASNSGTIFLALRTLTVHNPGDAPTSHMLVEHLTDAMDRREWLFKQASNVSSGTRPHNPPLKVNFNGRTIRQGRCDSYGASPIGEDAANMFLLWNASTYATDV